MVFCRRNNAGERLLSVCFLGCVVWFAIAFRTTVSVQNKCSERGDGHRIFGGPQMQKSYAARDGPVTPQPEDKDDPCPVCLNFTGES